jgi:NADH-quinone oxidoreductase subunit L
MSAMAATAARLIVLLPALAALAGLLVVRRGRTGQTSGVAREIAIGGAGLTLVMTVLQVIGIGSHQSPEVVATIPGLDAGELAVPLELQTAGPVALIALIVAVVGLSVQIFAAWYLAHDDRFDVFAATVSLFLAGMLLVVQSADLILTLVGWEVMGWCSYLLIGHWSRRESARRAALKAFIVTRLADVGFVLGVVILAAGARSTAYPAVLAFWTADASSCPDAAACVGPDPTLRSLALILLIMGILGKSAQFPFHDWLPDAMEGPTPASALIHAATMVAAGTFVLAQLFAVLVLSEPARWVLTVSTAVTMVGGAILAFGQTDLKRLLAYSTISQIAVMLSALAAAPPVDGSGSALLHLYSHAIFKALLFLSIGWLSVIAGGTTARLLRGSAAASTQVLRVGWGFGLIALAGVPVTVGGVSKEQVIGVAEAGASGDDARAMVIYGVLLLTVILTAAYATRAYLVVAWAEPAGAARKAVALRAAPPMSKEHLPAWHEGVSGRPDGAGEAVGEAEPTVEPEAAGEPEGSRKAERAGKADELVEPDESEDQPVAEQPEPDQEALVSDDEAHVSDDEAHATEPVPVAVVAVIGGLLGLTVLGGLAARTGLLDLKEHVTTLMTLSTLALIGVGAFVAYALAGGTSDPAQRVLGRRMARFDAGFGADAVYGALVARPVLRVARLVAFLDTEVIDAYVRGGAAATRLAGRLGVRAHSRERAATGLVWVVVGVAVLAVIGVAAR